MSAEGLETQMKSLVSSFTKMPDWVKYHFLDASKNRWYRENPGWIRIDHDMRRVIDEYVPEIILCLDLLDDRVKVMDAIQSTGASLLFDSFRKRNATIQEVNLSNNLLDDECIPSLGEFIKENKSIEIVGIGQNITDKGIEMLAPYLEGNTTLKKLLVFSNENITVNSVPVLIKVIQHSHIEDIDVEYTSIHKLNAFVIPCVTNILKYGSNEINLRERDVNDDDVKEICDLIRKYGASKIKSMRFEFCKITSKGATLLFDTMRECNVQVLRLGFFENQMDNSCIESLGKYLHHNPSLEILGLEYNRFTDTSLETLSDYIIGNITLKEFQIKGNDGITEQSLNIIMELIKNTGIHKLDVDSLPYPKEIQQEMIQLLSIPLDKRDIVIPSKTKSAAKTT